MDTTLNPDIEKINQDLNALQKFIDTLPEKALNLGVRVIIAAIIFIVGMKLISVIRKVVKKSLQKMKAEMGVIQFLDACIKIALYFILLLIIVNNFGVDATGIVAVLGSAGVALGLALQGSLSNLAGGVLILLLKPFRVGDYIKEDSNGNEGTVKEIGIFYTKLATPDNKIIVLPNGNLANNSITNYSEAVYRRVDFKVGIAYTADIIKAKEILLEILNEDEDIDKNQSISVYVDSLGSSEVVMGLKGYCYNEKYWTVKWRVTEKIKLAFDREGIEIPFPQVTVHMGEN